MTSDLIEGLQNFKRYQYSDTDDSLMKKLVEDGQAPKYFVISCIDSRSNPGTIFRARPGAFFAHKAMGAIVRPYKQGTALAAALQFALEYNEVDTLIVLGHTECGAVKALAENLEDEEITSFINVAKEALKKAKCRCENDVENTEILAKTEEETVLLSVENLKGYPSVAKALSENRVTIKPWIFDIRTGDLLEYSEQSQNFEIISNNTNEEDQRQNA